MQENDRLDQISRRIIGAAIEVHRHLGPGLLESAYETCLVFELKRLALEVEEQKPLPVVYKEVKLNFAIALTWSWKMKSSSKSKRSRNYYQSTKHNSYRI